MRKDVFPEQQWETISPAESGFQPDKLDLAKEWLHDHLGDQSYRLVIIRGGRLVIEWNHNISREERFPILSASKSVYSNILGLAISENKISTADARVVDYYPEMMEIPEGEGPKPGRYAFEKDRDITFRQLISNTSGYMKPGEDPGKTFHYQTYGMNILIHAIATIYGYYNKADPLNSPGFKQLIEEKLVKQIGVHWEYQLMNFKLHERARLDIFGNFCNICSNALELARLGLLWCNQGRWKDEWIIPQSWMQESVQTASTIREHCPKEQWKYGLGFWTNDHGQLWPQLPPDGFCANGAGGHNVAVFPERQLVIVQNPGPERNDAKGERLRGNPGMLKIILDALE
jgi:CubicO group peptidase (beta-lactamase class C family)